MKCFVVCCRLVTISTRPGSPQKMTNLHFRKEVNINYYFLSNVVVIVTDVSCQRTLLCYYRQACAQCSHATIVLLSGPPCRGDATIVLTQWSTLQGRHVAQSAAMPLLFWLSGPPCRGDMLRRVQPCHYCFDSVVHPAGATCCAECSHATIGLTQWSTLQRRHVAPINVKFGTVPNFTFIGAKMCENPQ